MQRDKLFLLKPDFEDPAYPGKRFYCWHCALLEGVLASLPNLAARLDIERIAWPRPRIEVISLLGEENQSLPILVLAEDSPDDFSAKSYQGRRFVDDKDGILRILTLRHGFPEPHP